MGEYVEFQDKTNFKSDEYLKVNSAGYQICSVKRYGVMRTKGRVDFLILYIVKGEYTVFYRGEEYLLRAGDAVIYEPNLKQKYSPLPSSEGYWLHFTGIGAEALLREAGLYGVGVIRGRIDKTVTEAFENIIKESEGGLPMWERACASELMRLVVGLRRVMGEKRGDGGAELARRYISELYENYVNAPDLSDFARRCGVSESRFRHIFKDYTGVSAHGFLIKIRLKRAVYLLRHTTLSVSEIAREVGYEDGFYFSRLFKKRYGASPLNFRAKRSVDEIEE